MGILCRKASILSVLGTGLAFLTFGGLSCAPGEGESPTRGNLLVLTAESIYPAVKEVVEQFNDNYPNAHISLLVSTSREAIVKLLNNEARVAMVGRALNEEEWDVVRKNELHLDTIRVALDGIAILVHPSNPIEHLSLDQLYRICTGKVKRWSDLSPKGRKSPEIFLALGGPNTSIYEELKVTITEGEEFTSRLYPCSTSTQVLQLTREQPEAIGFVGTNWIQDEPEGVKIMEIGSGNYFTDVEGAQVKYFSPHQAHVYRGYYPLRRNIYILSRERGYGLAAGFIAFVAGASGQKILKDNGLVPATMPVQLVPYSAQ